MGPAQKATFGRYTYQITQTHDGTWVWFDDENWSSEDYGSLPYLTEAACRKAAEEDSLNRDV